MHAIDLRHDLFQHPGLSDHESYAHDLVVRELQPLAPVQLFTHVGGYGVIALFGRNQSDVPTLAFRADTDALPIGHRCGHDGHTAILLRLASLLAESPSLTHRYNVILIWQPAEETGLGSQRILDAGILQRYNIQVIYALHNLPGYAMGQIVYSPSTFAAASMGIIYNLVGRPTHASTPELGLNPGLAVAEIIESFDRLNSGTSVPQECFKQSTLIRVDLGQQTFGTSAGQAQIMFTLRAYTNGTMQQLLDQAHGLVSAAAQRHGLSYSYQLCEPFAATQNDSHVAAHLASVASMGASVQLMSEPFRWSEDFANYLLHYRGCMFGIGAGVEHLELHHPDYQFPDELIEPAARFFLSFIRNPYLDILNND